MSATPPDNKPSPAPRVPPPLIEALRKMRAPVVVTHVVPDADALGASCAMALAWSSQKCQPTVSLPQESLSHRIAFLADWARITVATPRSFEAADGFVVLDTAKKSRCNLDRALRETDWSGGRPVINIDHHATNTRFGNVNWVVETAASTCELVYELLRVAYVPIEPLTASLLYAGIQTDTLGFSLPTTTAWSLRAAAALVELGADVAELGERLCRSQRQSEFDLLRVIYANTKLIAGGQIAYSSVSYDEIHDTGCTAADIDDQINVPRSLDGVRLAMLFSEGYRGKTRINFRGSGNVTVLELAAEFGGGGHVQAAGAVLDCGLTEAMEKVVAAARSHLENFDA